MDGAPTDEDVRVVRTARKDALRYAEQVSRKAWRDNAGWVLGSFSMHGIDAANIRSQGGRG